jgi:hypothetical protein
MPKIADITNKLEKKIDLTPFFGEEAYITIKKMSKYTFSHLINKNRNGYSMEMYRLLMQWKDENSDKDDITSQEYDAIKKSISVEETEKREAVENEVNMSYFEESIMKTKHNFTDDDGNAVEISGEWFYKEFSNLKDTDRRVLVDVVITEIINFNQSGISLGE